MSTLNWSQVLNNNNTKNTNTTESTTAKSANKNNNNNAHHQDPTSSRPTHQSTTSAHARGGGRGSSSLAASSLSFGTRGRGSGSRGGNAFDRSGKNQQQNNVATITQRSPSETRIVELDEYPTDQNVFMSRTLFEKKVLRNLNDATLDDDLQQQPQDPRKKFGKQSKTEALECIHGSLKYHCFPQFCSPTVIEPASANNTSSTSSSSLQVLATAAATNDSVFPRFYAHLNLKQFLNQRVTPRKEAKELQFGIERALYGFTGAHGKDALVVDRRNTTCLSLLIKKVTGDWSKPGVVNTRELRANPRLLKEVIVVLETIVFIIYDDQEVPSWNILPQAKDLVAPSVSALASFCARAALFGLDSAMEKKAQQSQLQLDNVTCAFSSILREEWKREVKILSSSANENQQEHHLGTESATVSAIKQKHEEMFQRQQEAMLRTAALYLIAALVKIHPDAVFPLWSILFPEGDPFLLSSPKDELPKKEHIVELQKEQQDIKNFVVRKNDAAAAQAGQHVESTSSSSSSSSSSFSYSNLGPMNNRCTLLSPLLGDDIMPRAAAIFTTVSLVAAIGNTLAVVPLEPQVNHQSPSTSQNGNTALVSHSSSSPSSSLLSPSHQHNHQSSIPPSEISRVGSVVLQVIQTIISALRIQDLNKEKRRCEILVLLDEVMQNQDETNEIKRKMSKQQQPILHSSNHNNTRRPPPSHRHGKHDNENDSDDELIMEEHNQDDVNNNNNNNNNNNRQHADPLRRELFLLQSKRKVLKAKIAHAAFELNTSSIIHYDLTNALGCLCVAIPLQRTPTITRMIFSYVETFMQLTTIPSLIRGIPISRRDGGQIHDPEVTGAVFLMQTLNHSSGARSIVRTFEIKPSAAGYKILEAAMKCLPHIDVWKLCSAMGRNQPDVFRLFFWSYIFPECVRLFTVNPAKIALAAAATTGTSSSHFSSNSSSRKTGDESTTTFHQTPSSVDLLLDDFLDEELEFAIAGKSNVMRKGSLHGRRSVPYQVHIEALRCLVYFIGARPFPWEVTLVTTQFQTTTQTTQQMHYSSSNSTKRHYSLKITLPTERNIISAALNPNMLNKRTSSPVRGGGSATTSSSSSGGSTTSSLAKYQQQQSNQAAFLTGGTLIAAIPRSTINSKTLISTRNRTIGTGVATNIIPDEKLLVADDQESEQSLLTFSSSSMNRYKRASTAEVARIVQEIIVPASSSAVENIRCVAYRVLATVPNEYFAVCVSGSGDTQRREIEETATAAMALIHFTLFTKAQIEKSIVKMITDKCRGEVDEPRLEALTACFNFVANCPCLSKIANQKISAVICDDLIGRNLVNNGDTRTRCCQVLEALAERIEFYCIDDEEVTVAECCRLLRASSAILAANEKQIRQLNQNIQLNSGTSNLVFTEAQRNELNTQIACCLRAIGSAVCHLPEDYLFMEFGPLGDGVVSWAFEQMIHCFEKYSSPSWLNVNSVKKNKNNNNLNDASLGHHAHHHPSSMSSRSDSSVSSTLVDATVTEDETIIMIAALDGLCRLSSKRVVAECDSESTSKTLRIIVQTINLFSTITELSNEIYFLCGGALRLGAKLFVEMNKNKSGASYFDDGCVTVAECIRLTISTMYRASMDADIIRGVLGNEINESCLVCIFALAGLMSEDEKRNTVLFSTHHRQNQNQNETNEELNEAFDQELIVLDFLKRSFPQVLNVLKNMIPTSVVVDQRHQRQTQERNQEQETNHAVGSDQNEDVKMQRSPEQEACSDHAKERSKSKFLASWS